MNIGSEAALTSGTGGEKRDAARALLDEAISGAIDYLAAKAGLPPDLQRRDPNEPGVESKTEQEAKLYRAMRKRFAAQKRKVRDWLEMRHPDRKDAPPPYSDIPDDLLDDPEQAMEIARIIDAAAKDGVSVEAGQAVIGIDASLVNTAVARWALAHAGELIDQIDGVTLTALRQAVADFATTPGMTIGDIMGRLPFDETRAMMIAVSETTNAYAAAAQEFGKQLAEQTGVTTVKAWFTNEDERVCDICAGNEAAGEIGIDETFPSGNDQPGAHPFCRCWMSTHTVIGSEAGKAALERSNRLAREAATWPYIPYPTDEG